MPNSYNGPLTLMDKILYNKVNVWDLVNVNEQPNNSNGQFLLYMFSYNNKVSKCTKHYQQLYVEVK